MRVGEDDQFYYYEYKRGNGIKRFKKAKTQKKNITFDEETVRKINEYLNLGASIALISRATGVSVYKLRKYIRQQNNE